jgi:endonuclease/exonuclease/phosphatase family metal-dependent hydrolase
MGFLTRRRTVNEQPVREPTLLTLALAIVGLVLLLALCLVAMIALPVLGHIWWAFAGIAAVLAWLILGVGRKGTPALPALTGRQRALRRVLGIGRVVFIVVLTAWLGLIVWSVFGPGGPSPPPKADPALIRVITWNIHCGQDEGLPWKQFDWPNRKHALKAALDEAQPDILCVQEATPDQVAFLEGALPGHRRVGVGRDDGQGVGEHCAIFLSRQRFELLRDGTFWLEEPIDQPRVGSALGVKRICTWARLRDRESGRTLRVYNTHLYLTEGPRREAARLILEQIAAGDRGDAVLLTADFNASPSAPSRQMFGQAGLVDSAERAGQPVGRPTFHLYGIAFQCLDGILVDTHWRVHNHLILSVKPGHTLPSDHFAVLADLGLEK